MLDPLFVASPEKLTCEGVSPIWDAVSVVRTALSKHTLIDTLQLPRAVRKVRFIRARLDL